MDQINEMLNTVNDLLEEIPLNYINVANKVIETYDMIERLISAGQIQRNEQWVKKVKKQLIAVLNQYYRTGNSI